MEGSGELQVNSPRQSPPTLNDKMIFSILNVNEIELNIDRIVCVLLIRAKAILEGEVIYPKSEMKIKLCRKKLMI